MDRLPFARGQDLLALAPRYRQLQQQAPVSRVCTPAGDTAWLVGGYPAAKALAADPRLARSHPDPAGAAKVNDSALRAFAREGTDAEHRRVRRLLAPAFSAKRMAMLRTHVADLVEQILGGLPAPPVDLHAELSTPLPVMVICELLGAPYADHTRLRDWSNRLAGMTNAASSDAAKDGLRSGQPRPAGIRAPRRVRHRALPEPAPHLRPRRSLLHRRDAWHVSNSKKCSLCYSVGSPLCGWPCPASSFASTPIASPTNSPPCPSPGNPRTRDPSRLKESVMFLLPLLFHSYLGLTGTIVLVIALVALQTALRRRRARRSPGPQEPRDTTHRPHHAWHTDNDDTTTPRPSR